MYRANPCHLRQRKIAGAFAVLVDIAAGKGVHLSSVAEPATLRY